jgi:hypothetical protein
MSQRISMTRASGDPNGKANQTYCIWYNVTAPGGTPPTNPDELRRSFYARRKKDRLQKKGDQA